jgi:predicted O-methyltransferase YrrM
VKDALTAPVALMNGASFACLALLLALAWKLRQRFGKLDKNLGALRKEFEAIRAQNATLHSSHKLLEDIARRTKSITSPLYGLRSIKEGQHELGLQQSLASLPTQFPIFYGAWAIDGFVARAIVDRIERSRPKTILELGSGSSTALIAATLKALGMHDTRHIAVDHHELFLDTTRRNVQAQGLGAMTEFWVCPLKAGENDDPPWYEGLPEKLKGVSIDLVIVDGPPGTLHPHARRPALDILKPYLSEGAVLLLDDAGRPAEQATLRIWEQSHPDMKLTFTKAGKGYAELERVKAPEGRSK